MNQFRFSLKGLLSFIAVLSIACAAIANPSELWVAITGVMLFACLFFALFGAIYSNPPRRAFWLGFAIAGWMWFGLELLERPTRLKLPTALLSDYLQNWIHPAERSGIYTLNVEILGRFREVMRSLWPLVLGVIGGIVAHRLRTARLADATSDNDRIERRAGLWLIALAAAGLCGTGAFAAEPLRAGAAKRRVTPPLWVPYLTSSGNGTNAPFKGVHDDLYARAIVFDNGASAVAVLAVDSIGYDNSILGAGRNFTRELRARVAAKTGLKPGAIMLAASHTHSAPETIGLTPMREMPRVAEWFERHLDDLVQTVVDAWSNRQPVRLRCGKARVEQFARYRRILLKDGTLNRNGPLPKEADVAVPWQVDEELTVIYAETGEGAPHAVLLNYTAHPVIAMLLPEVSADYPGAATSAVENALDGAVCLFTQGAAGNVNSPQVSGNFDDVRAAGRQIADAALTEIKRLKAMPPLMIDTIDVRSQTCSLAARPCPPLAEAVQEDQARSTPLSRRMVRLAAKLQADPLDAEVQAMRVGPVRWVSLPGEAFVETGMALKQAGATFVVGYANGYLGYLPIRRAYAEGGYEADAGPWSRVAPGSAERLQAIGESLLTVEEAR
ncbi:MAG TPA: hypothetical protein VJ783_07735 [Pirellulales bacterium]|nr:hypothetical protein [Pirellulales bacterium]